MVILPALGVGLYERKRMPTASFDDLCRNAIASFEQDNRQSS